MRNFWKRSSLLSLLSKLVCTTLFIDPGLTRIPVLGIIIILVDLMIV
jgi:hypothetical protein